MASKKAAAQAATVTEETAEETVETVTETAAETAQKEETMANKETAETVRLMYVGPSLPHGLLKCNTVFTGTKDEILTYINEAVQEYPEVERLMIPTDKVATIKTKIKTPGNLYNNYSEKIKSLIAQKGGNR